MSPELADEWRRMAGDWDRLELDRFLHGGAKFRRRRYGRYYWSRSEDRLLPLPAQAYFQPADENAYAGGIEREFAPLLPETLGSPFLSALARCAFDVLPLAEERRAQNWEVRVHQIRIVASAAEAGLPAPEGIHQDGTDFLTLHMVRRRNVEGGVSTIYDLERRPITTYTMMDEMDSFILEDPRIMHGVTPVVPADGKGEATRDLLGLDFIYSPGLLPHLNPR
jgi:hypothetical protein